MQHNFDIPNQQGAEYRADVNRALQALATLSSGPVAPAAPYPHMLWMDTSSTPPVLRRRSADNTFWQVVDPGTVNSYFKRNADGDVVALSPEELAGELGLGTAATRNVGSNEGDVPSVTNLTQFGLGPIDVEIPSVAADGTQSLLLCEWENPNHMLFGDIIGRRVKSAITGPRHHVITISTTMGNDASVTRTVACIRRGGGTDSPGILAKVTYNGTDYLAIHNTIGNSAWSQYNRFVGRGVGTFQAVNNADLTNITPIESTQYANTALWFNNFLVWHSGNMVQPIGVGQTWQDVTSQRAWSTTYTNTTGRPIAVYVRTFRVNGHVDIFINVSGVSFYGPEFVDVPGGKSVGIFAIVPPGATYMAFNGYDAPIYQWCELR